MNKRGNPESLIASHPGNFNAVKQGAHSPRLIQARAAEIAAAERRTASDNSSVRADYADCVRALQRIALGHDTSATARDRLSAIKELLELGQRGTTTYLDSLESPEARQRWNAVHDALGRHELRYEEHKLGL
jgi:hypothetical protein